MTRTKTNRSARNRYFRRYATQYWKDHWILLSLGLLEILGIWIGARLSLAGEGEGILQIPQVLHTFLVQRTAQPIQTTLMRSCSESFTWLFLLFCSGFSLISAPCILLIPVVKGMGFGLTAASMVLQYGNSSLLVLLLVLIPSVLAHSAVLLIGCRTSLLQSLALVQLVRGEGGGDTGAAPLSRFCIQMGILCVFALLAAAAEGVLYTLFRSLILGLVGG